VNRLSWNEYPVMAAVAAVAGIGLFLLLQTIGSGPAGEQPLRRAEPASANLVSPPFPSQVEAARQDRVRQRAVAKRRARARARRAAAAVPAASPRDYSDESSGSQPYERGQQQEQQQQQQAAPSPNPAPAPKPKAKQPAPSSGRSFDDSG
jgi:hypothetical protein